jgi:hypothetical protein
MSAKPLAASYRLRKCAGDSVTITSSVGRTRALPRCPAIAWLSAFPTTMCRCKAGFPSGGTAMSPRSDATSTCSSTGIDRLPIEISQLNLAERANRTDLGRRNAFFSREIAQGFHDFISGLKDHDKSSLAARFVKKSRLHSSTSFPATELTF